MKAETEWWLADMHPGLQVVIALGLFCLSGFSIAREVNSTPCAGASDNSNQRLIKHIIRPTDDKFRYQLQVSMDGADFRPVMQSKRKFGITAMSDNKKYLAFTIHRGPFVVLYIDNLLTNQKRILKKFNFPLQGLYFSVDSRCLFYEDDAGLRNTIKL